jgi:hypothetical protein
MIKKILNLFPANPKDNGPIAGPALVFGIPLTFAYLPTWVHVIGVLLLILSALAFVRIVTQWNKRA